MSEEQNVKMSLEHSESLSGVATALCKVQSEVRSIGKDSSGYGYKYSSVSEIMDYLLPILSKNDLAITQFGAGKDLVTMLIHSKSGEYIKGRVELPDASIMEMKSCNIAQKAGSLRTYFKRYCIGEIVGLTSNDEDNDASSSGYNKKENNPKTETKKTEDKPKTTSPSAWA